jgi:hypothetical protein
VAKQGVTLVMKDWYSKQGTRELFGSRSRKRVSRSGAGGAEAKAGGESGQASAGRGGAARRGHHDSIVDIVDDSLANLLLCDSSETMNILHEVKQLRLSARPVMVETLPSYSFDDIDDLMHTMVQGKRE